MKGEPTPQDWNDFANPPAQWKDKISFYDPRTSSLAFTVLATLHQQLGADGARKIYAGLRSMNAELSSSTPAGTTKLLSGEKPIMFYILTNQYGATVAKGAPLVFNVPKSGAIGTHFGVATLRTHRIRMPPSCGQTSFSRKVRRWSPAAPNMLCEMTLRRRRACQR